MKQRESMRALLSPGILHGAVESCINGERARLLWRTDVLGDKTYLLLLSADLPDCTNLIRQFGYPDTAAETKSYDSIIACIEPGQRWRFRLRANPVKSEPNTDRNARGKLHAHVTQTQQMQWLAQRAQKNGFDLKKDEFDVTDTRWLKFKKHVGDKREVTLRTATFEGVLTVTDAELFKKALTEGIGRAKAYGCGLLTIISE